MIITRHTASGALSPADQPAPREREMNVGKADRVVSVSVGAALLMKGLLLLEDKPIKSLLRLAIGGYLVHRGLRGHCPITATLNDTVDKAENLATNTFA